MTYVCPVCHKGFDLWKFWQKVKYEQHAKTIKIGNEEKTYYWKTLYHPKCARKIGL